MLLTITNTQPPATDLGYLLHKHPSRLQSFTLPFGQAHFFYPEASLKRCTAALLLDVDPVGLVRRGHSQVQPLEHYVNDRPYVASSFLSVAISRVLGTALAGRSKDRPDLPQTPLPLSAKLSVIPCHGGEALLKQLFEPLGYTLLVQQHTLDRTFSDWGNSTYFTVELQANTCLPHLLAHLYVLVPVLDNEKHYWVGDEEVNKLLHHGEGWLASHPERTMITNRYLKHQRSLTHVALTRLVDQDNLDPDDDEVIHELAEAAIEEPISLNQQRLDAVIATLKQSGSKRLLDLGCGEGKLLGAILADQSFEKIVGVDVSHRTLEIAQKRLHLDQLPPKQRERIHLIQGALTYRDKRLAGYDAATVVEVIEHLDPPRLNAFERVLFEFARPAIVVLTTPNSEYNVKFESLPAGQFRHKDHRFEWTREEFQSWAESVVQRFRYSVSFLPVGLEDPAVGPPTQMGVFTRDGQ